MSRNYFVVQKKCFRCKAAAGKRRSRYLCRKTTIMNIRLAIAFVFIAALLRILPHPDNFTPLGAMGLFGAAYFSRRPVLLLLPFVALFLSDLYINNVIYSQFYTSFKFITSPWIYLAFGLMMLAGWALLRQNVTPVRVVGASLTASVLFFLVSNFSTWAETALYPKTTAGLMACYTAGLPFFRNTVLGDLFFCAALFGIYEWMTRRSVAVQRS